MDITLLNNMKNFLKTYWQIILVIVVSISIIIIAPNLSNGVLKGEDIMLGANYPDGQWINETAFTGYQTDKDPEKVTDGANPMGQNTTIFEGDRIGVREFGYELFPDGEATTSTEKITSIHTFRKRTGENILMRSYSTYLQFYDKTTNEWIDLRTDLSDGKKFGFADYNINTDLSSWVYFGNGYDNFMRWSGSVSYLTENVTSTSTVIPVNETTYLNSTSTVLICGQKKVMSSKSTTTITISTQLGIDCDSGGVVVEYPEEFPSNPKGNIYINYDNRLFIGGITIAPQAVYFSKYGYATDFIGASLVDTDTASSPGIFNLGEGGGAVTGFIMQEDALYIFKRNIIYNVTLTDVAYSITPLKAFDGRSQTTGATHNRAIFTGGNGVYFTTPDNQILSLSRVESIDYPQTTPISTYIKNTLKNANFDNATGIVFKDKAYFAFKSNKDVQYNDVVFVWNISKQYWDSPVVGLNVEDFTVYDNGNGEELYFASSNSTNIYKFSSELKDDIYDIKANWRSKMYNFGTPAKMKEITGVFIDGYISENTTLNISLLLDDNGYSQIFTTTLKGDETNYLYNFGSYNVFGFNAFGTERFGSNPDLTGKKRFRLYLNGFRAVPFYNAQLEFASEGQNQNWEVTNYSIQAREYSQPELRKLYKQFK